MSTPSIQIADALVTYLTAQDSSWSVSRKNVPLVKKEEVPNTGFIIQVTPVSFEMPEGEQARNVFTERYTTIIACYRKALGQSNQDQALEDLDNVRVALSSEAGTNLTLSGGSEYSFARLQLPMVNDPVYDIDRMKDEHIFQSVITLNHILLRNRS